MTEWPERLQALRECLIDCHPVEKEVRRVRGGAHERDPQGRSSRPCGHEPDDDANQHHGAEAVGDRSVAGEQQIDIGRRRERGARDGETITGSIEPQRGWCRRTPGALSRDDVDDPGRQDAGERVADRARHARRMMADCAYPPFERRK